ncbi:MAG TPA: PssD/Cps14F family polysaccharide biosynthesis glycosyltransferase [Anaerolineae bacterium]
MKIGLICSHGGHLTEMLGLIDAFSGHDLFFATYESARVAELRTRYPTYALQNIGTSPWRAFKALLPAWRILRLERPQVIVSTGSEIALPFFLLARLLRIRTIFVESVCRVETASQTGRVLYPLADVFLVQWPQLLARYGRRARYEGGLL